MLSSFDNPTSLSEHFVPGCILTWPLSTKVNLQVKIIRVGFCVAIDHRSLLFSRDVKYDLNKSTIIFVFFDEEIVPKSYIRLLYLGFEFCYRNTRKRNCYVIKNNDFTSFLIDINWIRNSLSLSLFRLIS